MSALDRFLAIRRAVFLWDTRAARELGGIHGLGASDFPSPGLTEVNPQTRRT
jgi:hypothetical protein